MVLFRYTQSRVEIRSGMACSEQLFLRCAINDHATDSFGAFAALLFCTIREHSP
jgi:hypothetical protein